VHKLSQGSHTISKPSKLETNFRSHTGILQLAATVLKKLFIAFPASAAAHTTDVGISNGPRPEFHLCSSSRHTDDDSPDIKLIKNLMAVNERLVILTPESNMERLNSLLGNPMQLLGVRQSKGLEFTDILLVDFFGSLPKSDWKAWKTLVDVDQHGEQYPQVEHQLKLLYVAITRACNRLIFIETKPSGMYHHHPIHFITLFELIRNCYEDVQVLDPS